MPQLSLSEQNGVGRPNPFILAAIAVTLVFSTLYLYVAGDPHHLERWTTWTSSPLVTSMTLSGATSAWFHPGGYLRLDQGTWATSYDTQLMGSQSLAYACDEVVPHNAAEPICRNNLTLVNALVANSEAQSSLWSESTEEKEADPASGRLQETGDLLKALRGKRILVLGDSTDRNAIRDLQTVLPSSASLDFDPSSGARVESSFHNQHDLRVTIASVAANASEVRSPDQLTEEFSLHQAVPVRDTSLLRIDFLFLYGSMHRELWDPPPVKTLERLSLAHGLFLGPHNNDDPERSNRFDAVFINFGLWDLVAYNTEIDNADSPDGLSLDFTERYTRAVGEVVKVLRTVHGQDIPIFLRTLHDVSHSPSGGPKDTNRYRPLRVQHLRQAQHHVAKRYHLHLLPFGELLRGQEAFLKEDGFHPAGPADTVFIEMMLRAIAGHT